MTDAGELRTDTPEKEPSERLTSFRARGFFPADFAAVENGKVYASGAYWSLLRFETFPAVLPSMALIAVIEVPFHAYQADHAVEMSLVDPDDKPRGLRVGGVFRSAPGIEAKYGAPGLVPLVVPVHGLQVDGPGDYSFVLKVDTKEIDRYSFSVIQVASVPTAYQPPASPAAE
jgi:hypothetical protein